MNLSYRTVWNQALGVLQVASELARGRGKSGRVRRARRGLARSVVAFSALAVLTTGPAWAQFSGGAGAAGGGNGGGGANGNSGDSSGASVGGGTGGTGIFGSTGGITGGGGSINGFGGAGGGGGGGVSLIDGTGGGGGGGAGGSDVGVAGDGDVGGTGGTAGTGISAAGNGGDGGGFEGGGGGGGGGSGGTVGSSGASSLTNSLTLTGGDGENGGNGGHGSLFGGGGGGGGGGGFGLVLTGANSVSSNSSSITGGSGGSGGISGDSGGAGGGGSGGGGVLLTGSGATFSNSGTVLGNAGGAGGLSSSGSGSAGNAGMGVAITAAGTLTNTGTIRGGTGGNGGVRTNGELTEAGGNGGAGGNGVQLTDGGVVNNLGGTITGGNGGTGGASGGVNGATGAGGEGIAEVAGNSLSITNSGTISGGLSGDGTARGDAIEFGGGNNTLTLLPGSTLIGNIGIDSGSVTFNQSSAQALANTITGGGALVQNGTGTLTLSGTNTYSGGTTISGGTLAAGNNSALGTGAITMANGTGLAFAGTGISLANSVILNGGSTFTVASGQVGTLSSTISEGGPSSPGAVNVAGGGELVLSAVNTYSGGTAVTGGSMLSVSRDSNLGATSGSLSFNGGTLQFGASFNLAATRAITLNTGGGTFDTHGFNTSVSQAITGAGSLTKTGAGTLTLTSANLYTGGTTINAGTLALGAGGSLSAIGAVNLTASGATFDISAAGNQTVGSLTGVAGSDLVLGANLLTLNDQTNQIFDGNVSGTTNLVKQGTGTQVFNGNDTGFTGTTEIAAGTFEVGDVNNPGAVLGGSVTVDAAGTLRGHGTIVGDVTNNGFVMPGGSVGTLTVNGNYTQASTATLTIEVNPTTGSQLKVNGAANLNGSLAILYDPGTYAATQYTILSATNGVNGRFSSVASTVQAGANLGALQQTISYQANEVDLALTGAPTPANQIVVGPIDTSIYTALGSTLALGAQNTNAALLDRLSQPRETGALNGWATATGAHTRVGATHGEPGFQADQYGFMTGLDHQVGNYTVGIAAGYNHADIDEQITGDSGTTDTLRAALYASRWLGPVGVSATLGYGLDFLSQKRPFGAAIGTATGDHMGQEVTAASQASLPMTFAGFTLTPSLGLRYAYVHGNAFAEGGANGQDLGVGTDNVHSLQPYTEITLDKAFGNALRPVNVQVRVGYAQELLDTNRAMAVSAQDGTVFAAPGTNLPHGQLTTGLSVSMQPSKSTTVSLSYDALLDTNHASAQTASLKLGYRF